MHYIQWDSKDNFSSAFPHPDQGGLDSTEYQIPDEYYSRILMYTYINNKGDIFTQISIHIKT